MNSSLLSRLLALNSATQWNETISKVGFIFSKLRIRFQKWFEKKMNMMSLFSTLIMQSHRQMTMRLSYWTTPSVQGEKTNRKLTYGLLISSKANLNFLLVTVVIRKLRPEFKFSAFFISPKLTIRWWFN